LANVLFLTTSCAILIELLAQRIMTPALSVLGRSSGFSHQGGTSVQAAIFCAWKVNDRQTLFVSSMAEFTQDKRANPLLTTKTLSYLILSFLSNCHQFYGHYTFKYDHLDILDHFKSSFYTIFIQFCWNMLSYVIHS